MEGLPSKDTLDKLKAQHEGAISEAEGLGEEIIETEIQLVAALKEAEDLAQQIETAVREREDNPLEADLADTKDKVDLYQRMNAFNIKFILPIGSAFSLGAAASSANQFDNSNWITGSGAAVGAAVLAISTIRLLREGFRKLQESKLRADLLQEVINQKA